MNPHHLNSEATRNKSSSQQSAQALDGSGETAMQRALRVYLVEDSPQVRDLLLDFLNEPGRVEIVGFADNETDSVKAILADPVDAVIVDLKLREGNGMSVIEQLRGAKLDPQPKVIVFTNHPFPEIRKRAMQLGADFFFDKSSDYESVMSTLQAMRVH